MSTAAKAPRARRGRLLVIGLADLAPPLPSGVLCAKNIFDALGQITAAPSAQPIAAVVMAERDLPDSDRGANAIGAIRKIDPSVRIVVVASADSALSETDAEQWRSLGVDDCIVPPIRPDDCSRLFDEDAFGDDAAHEHLAGLLQQLSGAADDQEQFSAPRRTDSAGAAPPPPNPAARDSRPTSSRIPPAHASESAPMPAQPGFPIPPQPTTPPAPTQKTSRAAESLVAPEQLGDTDLVEAIMSGSTDIANLALQLIAQQTGWSDLVLSDAAQTEPGQTVNLIAIELHGLNYGHLGSTQASAAQLKPWADWLARWIALEHTVRLHRTLAYQDDLTQAGNRRFFEEFLQSAIARAAKARRPVTLMVFDIDNFKTYNDQYGHDAGDDILREIVRLMQTVIRQGDRVCRIGGDEFAVIFADEEAPREPGSKHPESIESIAKRFQDQICQLRFPKLGPEAPGTLTISAGLATFPWDGADPDTLLRHADQLALESKRKGKNIITFGQGAMRACRPKE